MINITQIKHLNQIISYKSLVSSQPDKRMEANGVNYYKGVLLCSRPNESPSVQIQRPFCGRVSVKQELGLVPTKQYDERRTRKRQLPVLNNHKKWLQKFKLQLNDKKVKQQYEQRRKEQNLTKIREQGRERVKQYTVKQQSSPTLNYNTSLISPQKPHKQLDAPRPTNPHKKKAKPAWARTQQQNEYNQQTQVDKLLDFFQKGQTQEVKDYVTDSDVKKVLRQLKNKIQKLRQQGNQWKDNQMIKIQEQRRAEQQHERNDGKDDILSRISKQSGGQSVTSQKTAQRVEELQKKKNQQKQWQKLSVSSSKKSSLASVDQQIAKHIADQILRNYPNLKHHSNQSIRKLLQKQAREQLKA